MEDTIGLAGSLGLINKGVAAFGGNVLTRAANKELEISVAEKKAEAARLAKQAQEEKLLAGRLKVSGKFDDLARPAVSKAYTSILTSGGTRDAQQVYNFNDFTAVHEAATKKRSEIADDLNKNDYVGVTKEDKIALINHDVPYLKKRMADDPNSGIVVDPNLPDVYDISPDRKIGRLDINKVVSDISSSIPKDEASYDYSQKSEPYNVNGTMKVVYPVKESILNARAENVLGYGKEGEYQGNPELAANFVDAYKTKIKEVIKANPNMSPYDATKKVFIDVLRQNTMGGESDNIDSKKGSSNWSFGGGGASNGEIELTKRSGENGVFDVSFVEGKGSELKSFSFSGQTDKGKPVNIRFDSVSRIIKNLDGTASIYGDVSKSSTGVVKTSEIYNVPLSELESVLKINPEAWDKLEGKTTRDFDRRNEVIARQEKVDEWNEKYPNNKKTIKTLYPDDPEVTKFKVYQQEGWIPVGKSTTKPVAKPAAVAQPPVASAPVVQPAAPAPMPEDTAIIKATETVVAPVKTATSVTPPQPKIAQQKASIRKKYNIDSYATDPNHETIVDSIYVKLKEPTVENIDNFIKTNAKGSPITGEMVKKSADKYGVDPNALLAIIHADSTVGTKGKGARGKNAGNVGNMDDGSTRKFNTWEDGLDAVASWLKKHDKSAAGTASVKQKVKNKYGI